MSDKISLLGAAGRRRVFGIFGGVSPPNRCAPIFSARIPRFVRRLCGCAEFRQLRAVLRRRAWGGGLAGARLR
ncbi:MAG: hypothetical protein ACR2P5_05850 [Gammaproteobacteria bacterium]